MAAQSSACDEGVIDRLTRAVGVASGRVHLLDPHLARLSEPLVVVFQVCLCDADGLFTFHFVE